MSAVAAPPASEPVATKPVAPDTATGNTEDTVASTDLKLASTKATPTTTITGDNAETKPAATEDKPATTDDKAATPKLVTKVTLSESAKLAQLIAQLPKIIKLLDNPEYDEVFGYRINTDDKEFVDEVIRNEILLKFLKADEFDVNTAATRLKNTLNWRNKFQPLSAAWDEKHNDGLNKLGVIAQFPDGKANLKVATFNLYGNMQSLTKLFGEFGDKTSDKPGSQFLRWRIGLMERAVSLLDFTDVTNTKLAQVHDYTGVSLFRMEKKQKQNTKEIIEIFGANYPELLSTKFFVGVPVFMSWVFTFLKTVGIINKETLKKFNVISGTNLAAEDAFPELPKKYGGKLDKDIYALDLKNTQIPKYGLELIKKLGSAKMQEVLDDVE